MDLACCTVSGRDGSMRVSEGWRALPYLAEGSAGIGMVLRRYLAHREDGQLRAAAAAIRRASVSRFYAQCGLFAGRAGLLLALADGEMWDRAPASPEAGPADAAPGGSGAQALPAPAGHGPGPAGIWPAPFGAAASGAAASGAAPGLPPRRGVLPGPATYPAARTRPARPCGMPAGVPRGGPDALEQLRRLGWHAVGHRGLLAFPGDRLHRLSADLATGSAGVLLALGAVLGQGPAHLPFLGPPAARRGDGGRAGAAATKCER